MIAVLTAFLLSLSACGGEEDGDTATGRPQAGDARGPRYSDRFGTNGNRIRGKPLREAAGAYCGGEGQIGDFARILGLPRMTQNLDRIAMAYGNSLARNLGRDDVDGSPGRAAIRQAVYEGCLAGLRSKS